MSCKSDSQREGANGPEAVFVQWQKLVDAGQFAQAETLSTPITINWLKEIAEISDDTDSTSGNDFSEIQNISCVVQKDTAICTYQIVEEGEIISNSVQLVNLKGVWLVDLHEDNDEILEE
ncbi:MAG TPA: hypothetical protein ENK85_10695 [Saprospiraceae bacterium]|nr:hypothetical protein [Saprospiraceae bacterium]